MSVVVNREKCIYVCMCMWGYTCVGYVYNFYIFFTQID